MDQTKRAGNFTSSQAHKTADGVTLEKPTQKFKTYVEEKIAEVLICRSLSTEIKVRSMLWGKLMELIIIDFVGIEYAPGHEKTIVHKTIPRFSGTPDLVAENKHGEIKCFEPKNFALLSMCLLQKDIALLKKNFKEEYWQCVSNALLLDVPNAELIAFMPTKTQLEEIIKKVDDTNFLEANDLNPADYYWLSNDIETLPYLTEDSKIEPLNSFEFVVPQEDKDWLETRIIMGASLVDKAEVDFFNSIK